MRALFLRQQRRLNNFGTATTTAVAFSALLAASKMGPVRSFSAATPRSPPPAKTGKDPGAAVDQSFSFGIIADVQWADAPDGTNYAKTVKRCYRGALAQLRCAVDWWLDLPDPNRPLLFVAQLGDLIDGMNGPDKLDKAEEALGEALGQLGRLPCPSVNLVGNHELYNFDRRALTEAPWLQHGDREYYAFSPIGGWRVVVLDPYQIALIGHAEDDPRRLEAVDLIARENPNFHPDGRAGDWFRGMEDAGYRRRFVPYNGGFGAEQLSWLRAELKSASDAGDRAVVLSHVPLHPEACGGGTMAWDYDDALDVLRSEEAGGGRDVRAVGPRSQWQLSPRRMRGASLHLLFATQQGGGGVCVRDDGCEIGSSRD